MQWIDVCNDNMRALPFCPLVGWFPWLAHIPSPVVISVHSCSLREWITSLLIAFHYQLIILVFGEKLYRRLSLVKLYIRFYSRVPRYYSWIWWLQKRYKMVGFRDMLPVLGKKWFSSPSVILKCVYKTLNY